MRQLVELRRGIAARIGLEAFWVRRRYEPQIPVKHTNQFIEVTWTVLVAGSFQKLSVGPHVAFDVGAHLRQQSLENSRAAT